MRIPLNLMELHYKGKGIAGHELIAGFDNIKILKPTGNAQYEGFQILMSGSGCRNYENFLTTIEEMSDKAVRELFDILICNLYWEKLV